MNFYLKCLLSAVIGGLIGLAILSYTQNGSDYAIEQIAKEDAANNR